MPEPITITNPASLPPITLKAATSLQTLLIVCQRYGGAKRIWHLLNDTLEMWYAECMRPL